MATLLLLSVALPWTVPASERTGEASTTRIVALQADHDGQVLAAYRGALVRIQPRSGESAPITLPSSVSAVDAFAVGTGGILYLAAPGQGLWVSQDRGDTWQAGNDGLPGGKIRALAAHASQERTAYAYVASEGIYRSEDAGRTWQLMDAGPEDIAGPFIHSDMPGSMQTGWLFAATSRGVSRSMDCFCLWRSAGALDAVVSGMTYDPEKPERIFAATAQGVFRSPDGGEGWIAVGGPAADLTAISHAGSGTLYAGTAAGEVYVSTDEATSWRRIHGARP